MSTPRCCPTCNGLFPLPVHLGLQAEVYCMDPEHWHAVGLDPARVTAEITAYTQREHDMRTPHQQTQESLASLRTVLTTGNEQEIQRANQEVDRALEREMNDVRERHRRLIGSAPDDPASAA